MQICAFGFASEERFKGVYGRRPGIVRRFALVAATGFLVVGCGGDDGGQTSETTPAARSTPTAEAEALERVVGTYKTRLTRKDMPEKGQLPPQQVVGKWTVTIAATGGVNNGPSIRLEHAEKGVYLTPGVPDVQGNTFVERDHHCWSGELRTLNYPMRVSADALVLQPPKEGCRDEGEAVLTSHPLKRVD